MMNLIKRFFKRLFKSLVSTQGPAVLTFIFAIAQQYFFPYSPFGITALFALFIIYIFARYVRW